MIGLCSLKKAPVYGLRCAEGSELSSANLVEQLTQHRRRLLRILQLALGDRVTSIQFIPSSPSQVFLFSPLSLPIPLFPYSLRFHLRPFTFIPSISTQPGPQAALDPRGSMRGSWVHMGHSEFASTIFHPGMFGASQRSATWGRTHNPMSPLPTYI